MASERSAAKSAITEQSQDDPELNAALSAGYEYQLRLTREQNRHAEQTQKTDLGFLGRAFGGEKSSPTYIAFIATAAGAFGAFFCWWQAIATPERPVTPEVAEFWSKQAERALAFSAAALAFIFGRGAK